MTSAASPSGLQHLLMSLETELHRPAARQDAARLAVLLHPDFREFGRSGAAYDKDDILARLPAEAQPADVVSDSFELRQLADDVALLTYRSAHRLPGGVFDRFTLRTSVWQHGASGWQMRFHQGTPTEPFAPRG